jgi:hypothetical protein
MSAAAPATIASGDATRLLFGSSNYSKMAMGIVAQ